ncbi:actin-related protein 2/3 complex subunit 5 [Chaetomium sp. MPI-CAGE-AT-0009]|nr:actin-related protein 2/3 complex subunit 5 [Chaetomium sp. MPI-CAGE-AT-0009]
MSIIREHTQATLSDAWRTINIDALEEDSSVNFDTATLHPGTASGEGALSEADVRQLTGQVRQLLRGGDAEGALRGCLETPAYGAAEGVREAALQTVIEVLQSIKASDMTPMLQRVYASPGGSECLDVLMKYLYKGMAATSSASSGSGTRTPTRVTPQQTGFSQIGPRPGAPTESTGAAMSVLLSWHEKVVEVAGLGCIGRVMSDWRRV